MNVFNTKIQIEDAVNERMDDCQCEINTSWWEAVKIFLHIVA